MQGAPASMKMNGAVGLANSSMRCAISRISHCARLQQRKLKKCSSSRTFIVMTIFVSAAFGSR